MRSAQAVAKYTKACKWKRRERPPTTGVRYHNRIEYRVRIESEFEGEVDVCRQIGIEINSVRPGGVGWAQLGRFDRSTPSVRREGHLPSFEWRI